MSGLLTGSRCNGVTPSKVGLYSVDEATVAGTRSRLPGQWAPILGIWVASRGFIFLVVALVVLTAGTAQVGFLESFESRWNYFETIWYASIAEQGYAPDGEFRYNTAYFPATAGFMKAGLAIGISPVWTGLLVSFIAGGVAATALGSLTQWAGGKPIWGVVAWVLAPMGIFLAAPWSEALFAAFAFPAWVLAREGKWIPAGILAAAATTVRINGLFLAIALVVMFVLGRERPWRKAWPLLLPAIVLLMHALFLGMQTGRWSEWLSAHGDGWGREFTDPVTSLINTVRLTWEFNGDGTVNSRFPMEILTVVLLIFFMLVLGYKKWWPELTFVALTVAALTTSTFYYSIPRNVIVLFPIWMLWGVWLSRSRPLRVIYIAVAVPALGLMAVLFAEGQWLS